MILTEQKARVTYDNLLRLIDDPDVRDPLKFLRQREIVHYQRFGDALRIAQDRMNSRNFYAINPSYDCDTKEKEWFSSDPFWKKADKTSFFRVYSSMHGKVPLRWRVPPALIHLISGREKVYENGTEPQPESESEKSEPAEQSAKQPAESESAKPEKSEKLN